MNFKCYFHWESPKIPTDIIYKIDTYLLDELYLNNYYKNNVYFKLLNTYIYLLNDKFYKEVAYISYLISYWIFVLDTPPNSQEIAMYYINKSIKYDKHNNIYTEFLKYVKNGN